MNVLGIGPLEVIVVLILGLLVLGPEGMVKAGRKAGRVLRKLYSSDFWQAVRGSGNLLEKWGREWGLTEDLERVRSEVSGQGLPSLEDLDDYRIGSSGSQPRPRTAAGSQLGEDTEKNGQSSAEKHIPETTADETQEEREE